MRHIYQSRKGCPRFGWLCEEERLLYICRVVGWLPILGKSDSDLCSSFFQVLLTGNEILTGYARHAPIFVTRRPSSTMRHIVNI